MAIKLKRSTTAGNVPSSLVTGEIAVNEADGALFYRSAPSGTVTRLSTTPPDASVTTAKLADGAVTLAKTTGLQKTITSGTAAPTGGSDGDIYLQYT